MANKLKTFFISSTLFLLCVGIFAFIETENTFAALTPGDEVQPSSDFTNTQSGYKQSSGSEQLGTRETYEGEVTSAQLGTRETYEGESPVGQTGVPLDQTQGFQDALNRCPPGIRCVIPTTGSNQGVLTPQDRALQQQAIQRALDSTLPSGRGSNIIQRLGGYVGGPVGGVVQQFGGALGQVGQDFITFVSTVGQGIADGAVGAYNGIANFFGFGGETATPWVNPDTLQQGIVGLEQRGLGPDIGSFPGFGGGDDFIDNARDILGGDAGDIAGRFESPGLIQDFNPDAFTGFESSAQLGVDAGLLGAEGPLSAAELGYDPGLLGAEGALSTTDIFGGELSAIGADAATQDFLGFPGVGEGFAGQGLGLEGAGAAGSLGSVPGIPGASAFGDAFGGIANLAKGVTGILGGGEEHVPVKDFEAIATQKKILSDTTRIRQLMDSLQKKEYVYDPLAHSASNEAVALSLKQLFNHVNYGNNGNPYYVTNLRGYNQSITDRELQIMLAELDRVFVGNNSIQGILAQGYRDDRRDSFGRLITPTMSSVQINAFNQSFNNGGWGMWLQFIQPRNNPYGQYLLASDALYRRQQQALAEEQQKLAWGRGYQSKEVCVSRDYRGNCIYYRTVTPGSVYQQGASDGLKTLLEQMAANDELSELASPFLRIAFSNALGGGSTLGFQGAGGNPYSGPPIDALNIQSSKSSLSSTMNQLASDELTYTNVKTRSLVSLKEVEANLNTLIRFEQSLPSGENAEKKAQNIAFANQILAEIVKPTAQIVATQIVESGIIVEQIAALLKELEPAGTAQAVANIGVKLSKVAESVHGTSAIFAAEEELAMIFNIDTAVRNRDLESILREVDRPTSNLLLSAEVWNRLVAVFFGGEAKNVVGVADTCIPPGIAGNTSFGTGIAILKDAARTCDKQYAYAFTRKRESIDSNGDGITDVESESTGWVFLAELTPLSSFIPKAALDGVFNGKPNEVLILHTHSGLSEQHPPSVFDIVVAALTRTGPENTTLSYGIVDGNGLWTYTMPEGSALTRMIADWQGIVEAGLLGAAEINNAFAELSRQGPNNSQTVTGQSVLSKALTGDTGVYAQQLAEAVIGRNDLRVLGQDGRAALLKIENANQTIRQEGVNELLALYQKYGVTIASPSN